MQPAQAVGHLPVDAHRVGQPRNPEDPGVGGDEQDRRRQQPDVDLGRVLERPEVERAHDAEHGIAGVSAVLIVDPEQRLAVGSDATHRQRRQRDRRQQRVDREHRDHHPVDRLGHGPARVLGLLGHVRDRLDPGVGEHAQRDRDEEVAPRRRDAEVNVVDQDLRREHQHEPDEHDQHLGAEVDHRQHEVHADRLLDAADVDRGEHDDRHDPGDHVAGRVLERRPEQSADVMRDEERRRRDRQHVVEHLAPGREERPELVEGVARERRGPAGLGEHRGRLGVRRGGQEEDEPEMMKTIGVSPSASAATSPSA